jgi:hypothetical protein
MKKKLALLLALVAGCSATTAKVPATSAAPLGCCCTFGDCRERFTQETCVSEAEFQGWTYTWRAGPCTKEDASPASDRR